MRKKLTFEMHSQQMAAIVLGLGDRIQKCEAYANGVGSGHAGTWRAAAEEARSARDLIEKVWEGRTNA